MIKSSTNTPVSAVNYFNAHFEGLGYLDSLEKIMPKPGENFAPFWSAKFCMLEGHPSNPDKIPVDLIIPAEKALNELLPFQGSINDPDIKVFVGIRMAKYRGKPFVYGPESQYVGQLGICYSANLISVLHLKVGDRTINLRRNEKPATTDFGVTSAQIAKNAQSQQAKAKVVPLSETWPVVVYLDQNEPHFEETKERLKGEGYRWAKKLIGWVVPNVTLDENHPQFTVRMTELMRLGYAWNDQSHFWDYPFARPKVTTGQSNYRSNQSQFAQSRAFQANH